MLRTSFLALVASVAIGAAPGLAQTLERNGDESRISGLKLTGDQPIQIESDRLEVREAENLAEFNGNVTVTQGPTLLKSGRMIVYYAKKDGSAATGSSTIDRLEVDGKVYVKSEDQVATGDKGTFDMKSEVLTLTGNEVVLSQDRNVLVGCRLVVQMKTGKAQVHGCSKGQNGSGRVMMSITPGSRGN